MKIVEIKDRTHWLDFFANNGSPSFLQSWEWGNVQKSLGYEVLRVGVAEYQNLKALCHIIKIKSRRGNFLFIPHGPVFQIPNSNQQETKKFQFSNNKFQKKILSEFLNYLIALAKKEQFSFIRIAPTLLDSPENRQIFEDLGFRKAPIYMHAERLWVLQLIETHRDASLQKTDDQLLSKMRKTTRYLIRKAERDGVIIEKRTDEKAVDDFWKIYQKTAEREKFVPFSKEFIRNEFESFNKTGNAIFLFGKVINNVILNSFTLSLSNGFQDLQSKNQMPNQVRHDKEENLASALIVFTKSTAFYHQGASIHTKIPVTYALQWEAIKEARRRNCKFYNFWGIHQEGRTPKSWAGLTLFKTGFGGHQVDYLPTQDYIVTPKYYLTYFYEKFLEWRRGV